jgi:N-acetylmuramoyl-L-alanine amidase
MKTIAVAVFCMLLSFSLYAQQQGVQHYREKILRYLDHGKTLEGYFTLTDKGITMYASPSDKSVGKAEFVLDWNQAAQFGSLIKKGEGLATYRQGKIISAVIEGQTAQTGLKGKRIAIDPGHIAGDFQTGDLEKKHLRFDNYPAAGDSVEIAEGMLTFATATLLKQKLEEQGAIVMLTRNCNGCTAFGKTFEHWKKEDLKTTVDSLYKLGRLTQSQKQHFLAKPADKDVFRVVFRDWELQQRSKLINEFRPDISVVIHFNVDEKNTNWTKPTTKNANMAFVGGAFVKSDLATMEKRFEFLRLLITTDLEESIELSSSVLKQMESILKVPTAEQNYAQYLKESCLPTNQKGVYCRNLQLTRYIHGPMIYGESLYQDNEKECILLNSEEDKANNKRLQQVAESYFLGIQNYFNSK